ncbi:MAG: molybdopterin molybdotransferase MoeA [Propionicimonas sp.]|nr:molybdopterin molybdotransferase MoeA [Propionicimonas sp.]
MPEHDRAATPGDGLVARPRQGLTPPPRVRLSVAEYRAELLALVEPDHRSERVALDEAQGRVLAEDVLAATANPAFDNSAMDGYAVRYADVSELPARLQVVGELPAGSSWDPDLGPGECVLIMTAAPLPTRADTVGPLEDTDGGRDWVEVAATPGALGAHVRRSGEDYPAGAVVAVAGTRLAPGSLGAVATAGATAVAARPRPVVAVCATGDELVDDGAELGRGRLHESNSHALAAALRRDGAEVVRGAPLPDDAAALARWLDASAPGADLVLLTGGASVGAHDVVRDLLTARAGGVFRHVMVQPGKPQGWARWAGTPVVALPGNPLSATLCYEVFVRPLLARRLGCPPPASLVAVAASGWSCPPGRAQVVPVVLASAEDGRLLARPAHPRGSASHLASSLASADAIALVGEQVEQVAAGDLLEVQVLA